MSAAGQIPKAVADTVAAGGVSVSFLAWITDNTSLLTLCIGVVTLVVTGIYYYNTIKSRKFQDRLLQKEEIRKKELYEMSVKEHEMNMLILQKKLMEEKEEKKSNVTDITRIQQSANSK